MQEVTLVSGGTRLPALWSPPKPGKPSIVFLHGFPGEHLNGEAAHALAERGYGVLVFRYRGVLDAPGEFSFEGCEDDIAEAFAFARERSPDGAGLLGYSMGGWLGARFAAASMGSVDFLVLLAAVVDLPALRADWAEQERSLDAFFEEGGGILRGDPKARLREAHALYAQVQPTGVAGLLRMPVLMIHPTEDEEVAPEHVALLAERLPHAKLVAVEDDHDLERAQLDVAEAVDRFLAER